MTSPQKCVGPDFGWIPKSWWSRLGLRWPKDWYAKRDCWLITYVSGQYCKTSTAVFRQVHWSLFMNALEHQNSCLELESLQYWQPVKLSHHRRHAVEFSGSSNKSSSGVLKWLQRVHQPTTDANKKLVTVVLWSADEGVYQCLYCSRRQRLSDRRKLS